MIITEHLLFICFFSLLFEAIEKNKNNVNIEEKFRRLASRWTIIFVKRYINCSMNFNNFTFNVNEQKQINGEECERINITPSFIENPSYVCYQIFFQQSHNVVAHLIKIDTLFFKSPSCIRKCTEYTIQVYYAYV